MNATAYAKVNLALAVFARSADGFHPLRGIFQSVSLSDHIAISYAEHDSVTVSGGETPADESNLGWKAVDAIRRAARISSPIALDITKRIPTGAGLGGGSADAAAVLGVLAEEFGVSGDIVGEIAEAIGSDVPFSLDGGTKMVEGRGERLVDMEPLSDFALAIVVPPFSLSTPAVFAEWDRLDGPVAKAMDNQSLPPSLRGGLPIRNDLFPAAVSLDPRLGEWSDELETLWGASVAMSGSGSALFAFFSSKDEALGAIDDVNFPTRAAEALTPVAIGWEPAT